VIKARIRAITNYLAFESNLDPTTQSEYDLPYFPFTPEVVQLRRVLFNLFSSTEVRKSQVALNKVRLSKRFTKVRLV
jgi:hypothetical protein